MKKTITAFILVALVVGSFGLLSNPTVKAQTGQATVLSYSYYTSTSSIIATYSGDLVVVGEVQNTGSTSIPEIAVGANAANGSIILASTSNVAFGYNLAPGQKAPFYLDFPPETTTAQDATQYQSFVSSINNITFTTSILDVTRTTYTGVTARNGSLIGAVNSGTYTLSGTLQNTGSQKSGDVYVSATFYNSSGNVIAIGIVTLSTSLAPGATATFSLTPIDDSDAMNAAISSYSLLVQADVASSSSTPTPTPTQTQSVTQQPTVSPTGTQSGTSFSLNQWTTYVIVIAVVIVVAVIVGLWLFIRQRRKNAGFDLPPPPPPPPPPE